MTVKYGQPFVVTNFAEKIGLVDVDSLPHLLIKEYMSAYEDYNTASVKMQLLASLMEQHLKTIGDNKNEIR